MRSRTCKRLPGLCLKSRKRNASHRSHLVRDFCLDEFCQKDQRFLPTQVTSLSRDESGNAFLHDIQFGPHRYLFQCDRGLNHPRHVWVVEFVGVANTFVWLQLEKFTAKGMTLTGREVCERHFVSASDFGIEMINLAGESIWRKPFRHGARIDEGAVNSLRFGPEHSMKSDGVGIVCGHVFPLYLK